MGLLTKLKENSRTAFLIHLVLIGLAGTALILLFFFVYLPVATNHGETFAVPTVRGQLEQEAGATLTGKGLRYEVIDSTYDEALPPLSVVAQHPRAGEQVKANRKIYLTLNYATPPSLKLPANLINNSLKNAREQLSIIGLKVGEIKLVPYRFSQVVVRVMVKGKSLDKEALEKGYLVKQGMTVDLVIGDGKESTIRTAQDIDEEKIYDSPSLP